MRYFRVDYGFDGTRIIPIDETELEKAIYAHITGKVVVFNSGSVTGNKIIAITPDYHREVGCSYENKLNSYWNELEGIEKKYVGVIERVKNRVQYLIDKKQEKLIGKNVEIPELENRKTKEVSKLTSGLADKMKV